MKYTIEKLEKRNGDIVYRHKQDSGSFVSYSSTPTLQKYDLQGFRLVSRVENWRGSGSTVFQKMEKFTFDGKGAKKSTQPAIVYRTRAKTSDPWTNLSDDSTFPSTDPVLTKEVCEDNFSTKKLSGVTSSNQPCIKTEDAPEEYHGKALKIPPEQATFEDRGDGQSDELLAAVSAWDSDPSAASLKYGDIKDWDVSAITDMSHLFRNKQNITSLDLSNWDTSNVLNMDYMFYESRNLNSITFGNNFDTSNVTSMKSMFAGIYSCNLATILAGSCDIPALTSLDLSCFNTSNVENMSGMFMNCLQLTNITFGNNFDTSSVENMNSMFSNAQALTSLDISNWCVENLTEPINFARGAPFAGDSTNLPVWGTCPTP